MRIRRTLAFLIFAGCVLAVTTKNRAQETHSGSWTITKSHSPEMVEFMISEHRHGGMSSHSSDWATSDFPGVDFSKPGRQDVHFTITRDAGKIACEGYLKDGEGGGVFSFQPDANYPREMSALGFPIDEEKQFSVAVQDVSLEFARQMKNEHIEGLDADKLIAFRIFKVDAAFIHALRAEGMKASDSDQLVAFRIHGVTPQMVHDLRGEGYTPDEDTLVAMRIHGASPEWIAQLKQRGYSHVDLETLIAFRIHGVSPDFIDKLKGLGYAHPEPDDLIAMRIHNVTPEYISGLRQRGMRDLSIDQLVDMRIHGID
jgi:hypothetical protein